MLVINGPHGYRTIYVLPGPFRSMSMHISGPAGPTILVNNINGPPYHIYCHKWSPGPFMSGPFML